MKRLVVGLSGGVDSAAAAALLLRRGARVLGATLLMFDPEPGAADPAAAAAELARRLGIEHELIDCRAAFRAEVVEPFVAQYRAGRTPNPCVVCNPRVKFKMLLEAAARRGADGAASGHYARSVEGRLEAAADRGKDQSYFLHALPREWLPKIEFPLAELSKRRVRELARGLGIEPVVRPESREICFLGEAHYGTLAALEARPGEIRDSAGRVLGRHAGVHLFTVGQRHGLGVAATEPLYVLELRPRTAEVVVGPRSELRASGLVTGPLNVLAELRPGDAALVKLRARHAGAAARVFPTQQGCEVRFEQPVEAVAPGQSAVFYDPTGRVVLGGGPILRSIGPDD